MSAEMISAAAGTTLTLCFSYIPGLNTWFSGLEATIKRLIMLALLVLVATVAMGLACAGWGTPFGVKSICDQNGIVTLFQSLLVAVMANQAVYAISPRK